MNFLKLSHVDVCIYNVLCWCAVASKQQRIGTHVHECIHVHIPLMVTLADHVPEFAASICGSLEIPCC